MIGMPTPDVLAPPCTKLALIIRFNASHCAPVVSSITGTDMQQCVPARAEPHAALCSCPDVPVSQQQGQGRLVGRQGSTREGSWGKGSWGMRRGPVMAAQAAAEIAACASPCFELPAVRALP